MSKELLAAMAASVIEGEIEQAAALAHQALAAGMDPVEAIEHGYAEGIREVGEGFARGDYFLPHLAIGAEAMKEALAVLEPELARRQQERKTLGRVVIGTVAGDIHDIGKDVVTFMLDVSNFEVHDLGVDVPPSKFVDAIREHKPEIVGLSGFLTLAFEQMKRTVDAIAEEGLRDDVKIMIGGAIMDASAAKYVGADAYGPDAASAVRLAKSWTGNA